MPLINNTTISAVLDETSLGQHNMSCVYTDWSAKKISILVAYCFVFLGSFFGNTLIIIIFCKHRELRKTVNYFIVNMALSDLVFPLSAIPFQITELVTGSKHWRVSGILGSIFCKLFYFTLQLSFDVSAQSLVWIAIDRFVAVVFPIKRGLISTKIRTIAIVSTWILGGLFFFPSLVTSGLYMDLHNNTFCTSVNFKSIFPSGQAVEVYFWFHLTLRFAVTLFVIAVLYTTIAIALKKQSKALADTATNVQRHCLKKRRQAIQMAVVIVVLFYICVFPYTLQRFMKLTPPCAFQKPFNILADLMLCLSTVVNPIICLLFVESYRRGLRNILCPCSRRRNNRNAKREAITLKGIKNLPG